MVSLLFVLFLFVALVHATGVSVAVFGDAVVNAALTIEWTGYPPFSLVIKTATVANPVFTVHQQYDYLQVMSAVWNVDVPGGTLVQLVLYDSFGDYANYDFLIDYTQSELPVASLSSVASISAISVASTQLQSYTEGGWNNPTGAWSTYDTQSSAAVSTPVYISLASSDAIPATNVQSSVTATAFTTSGTFIIALPQTMGSESTPTSSRVSTSLAGVVINTDRTSSTAVFSVPDSTGTSLPVSDGSTSSSNTAAIVGGVLGGLLALILLLCCCAICLKRRRRARRSNNFEEGSHSDHDGLGLLTRIGIGATLAACCCCGGRKKRHSSSDSGHSHSGGFLGCFGRNKRNSTSDSGHGHGRFHGGALGLGEKRHSHSSSSSSSSSSNHSHTLRNAGIAAGAAAVGASVWSKLRGMFAIGTESSSSTVLRKEGSPERMVNWGPDGPHVTPAMGQYGGNGGHSGHAHGGVGVGLAVGGSPSSHSHHHSHSSRDHHHLGAGIGSLSKNKKRNQGSLDASGSGLGRVDGLNGGYVVDGKWPAVPHRKGDLDGMLSVDLSSSTSMVGQKKREERGYGEAVGIGAAVGVGAGLAAGGAIKQSRSHNHTHPSQQHHHHVYNQGLSGNVRIDQEYAGESSSRGHGLPAYEGAAYGGAGYGYGYGNGERDEKLVLKEREERELRAAAKVKKHKHKHDGSGSPFADRHSVGVAKSKSSGSSSSSSSSSSSGSSSSSSSGSSSSSSSSSSESDSDHDGAKAGVVKIKKKKSKKLDGPKGEKKRNDSDRDHDHDHKSGKKSVQGVLAYPPPAVTYSAMVHTNQDFNPYENTTFSSSSSYQYSQKQTPVRPPRPDVDLGVVTGPGGIMVKPTMPTPLAHNRNGSSDSTSRMMMGFGKHRRTSSSTPQSVTSPANPAAKVGHTRKISNPIPLQADYRPQAQKQQQQQQPKQGDHFQNPTLPSWALREDSRYPAPKIQVQSPSTSSNFSGASPNAAGFSNYSTRQVYPIPPQHPSRLSIVVERPSRDSSPASSTRWFQKKQSADVPAAPEVPMLLTANTQHPSSSSLSSGPQVSTMTHSDSTHTTISVNATLVRSGVADNGGAYMYTNKAMFPSGQSPPTNGHGPYSTPSRFGDPDLEQGRNGEMVGRSDTVLRRDLLQGVRNGAGAVNGAPTPMATSFPQNAYSNFNPPSNSGQGQQPPASFDEHRRAVESWGMAPSLYHHYEAGPTGSGEGSTSLNNRHLSNVTATSGRVLSDISSGDSEWQELQRQLKWADDHESHIMPADFKLKGEEKTKKKK